MLNIAKTTTVTTVTPVTTTATTTTPVTNVTTNTAVTTTVYADGTTPTLVTYSSPVVTENTSVSTAKVVTNSTQTAVTNAVANYSTRIDQYSYLQAASRRYNMLVDSNPLDRNYGGTWNANKNDGWNSYLTYTRTSSNTVDTYKTSSNTFTIGAESFVTADVLFGIKYDFVNANINGDQATGTLQKHHLGLYNLTTFNNLLVLKSDLGFAYDRFANTHTLAALNYANAGKGNGKDIWLNERLYSKSYFGFAPFVGGRFETSSLDAIAETGDAYTAQSFTATKVTRAAAEGGLRFDYQFGDAFRVIAEGGYLTPTKSKGIDGITSYKLNLQATPTKTISGTIGAGQQKQATLTDTNLTADVTFKF